MASVPIFSPYFLPPSVTRQALLWYLSPYRPHIAPYLHIYYGICPHIRANYFHCWSLQTNDKY